MGGKLEMAAIKYIDLFCGIGGFEQALKFLRVKHKVTFACDSDQHVKQSYLANHGKKLNDGDWYDDVIDFAEHHADKYNNKARPFNQRRYINY